MEKMTEEFLGNLAAEGIAARIFPRARLSEVRENLVALRDSGTLGAGFPARYPWLFDLSSAENGELETVVLTAAPLPEVVFTVSYRGRRRELPLPPGYCHTPGDKAMEQTVSSALGRAGFRCLAVQLPGLKLAAAKSGLCRYGRNNITYCEEAGGMGSFFRLYAFLTDMPAPADAPWGPAERMQACEGCAACARACPTGCIGPEHRVIRAERCLVFLNEGDAPFPEWLDPGAHHALVGCMACQRACPQNRGKLKKYVVENAFDEAELEALCAGTDFSLLPEKTKATLRRYDFDEYPRALSRNLRALLARV